MCESSLRNVVGGLNKGLMKSVFIIKFKNHSRLQMFVYWPKQF